MAEKHIDEISGVETTGHEWDGIRELNNPMPRWWVWTFYATILWAIGYIVAFPALPMITDATKGMLGWSSRQNVAVELADAKAALTADWLSPTFSAVRATLRVRRSSRRIGSRLRLWRRRSTERLRCGTLRRAGLSTCFSVFAKPCRQ